MKIADVDLFTYRLPLKRPLVLSVGTITERRGYLIKLTSGSGAIGWGDVAPLSGFSVESFDATERILIELKESLVGAAVTTDALGRSDRPLLEALSLVRRRSVRCGLEMAALNLVAVDTGRSLAELLSSSFSNAIPLNGLITLDDDAVERAGALRRDGYRTIKLKVGAASVANDIERVRLALGDGIAMRLDANLAWKMEDAVDFAGQVAHCRIEYIEEPLSDPTRLAEFVSRTGLSVALDESTLYLEPGELCDHSYASAVILKPTMLGGIMRSASWSSAARTLGMKVVVSSSFESGVGIAALAQFAAAYGQPDVAAGLDTLDRFELDVLTEPIDTTGGRIITAQTLRASQTVDTFRLHRIPGDE